MKKVEKIDDPDLAETLFLTIGTVQGLPPQLKKTKAEVDKQTQQKIPDYRAAVNIIDNGMSALSALAGRIVENFGTAKDNPKVPEQVRAYMKESTPRYQELKKIADDFSKTIRRPLLGAPACPGIENDEAIDGVFSQTTFAGGLGIV